MSDNGCDNTNLARAKVTKNDEFYTRIEDIRAEVDRYIQFFKGKSVFCNCNDGQNSQFFKYFLANFDTFELTRLVTIGYNEEGAGIMYEVCADSNKTTKATVLEGNGSFDSRESIAELDKCDIVCTNPPFSVFRDYVELLTSHGKQFLIVAPQGCTSYKQIFKKIVDGELWLGQTKVKVFMQPDGTTKTFGNICWLTNLPHKGTQSVLPLTASYYEEGSRGVSYEKYDNYDAINVDRVKDIPNDYYGVMGVPITILEHLNPEQFVIIGCNAYSDKDYYGVGPLYVGGKKKYTRVLIQRKESTNG